MNEPLISIIIPAYNASKTLDKCINSIFLQTYKNYEIILIDDGSTDETNQMCELFKINDSRFNFYIKKNGGVSSARNLGLQKAVGEWITFIDADDWIEPNYLNNFFSEGSLDDNVLYIQGAKAVNIDKAHPWPTLFLDEKINLSNICNYHQFNQLLIYGTPWGKLFCRKKIKENNLFFHEELTLHEDHLFYFYYILLIDYVSINSNTDYNYLVIPIDTSLSRSSKLPNWSMLFNSYKKLLCVFNSMINKNKYDSDKMKDIFNFIFGIYIHALRSVFLDSSTSKEDKYNIIKISRTDVIAYYNPKSILGKFIKRILLINNSFCKLICISCVIKYIYGK